MIYDPEIAYIGGWADLLLRETARITAGVPGGAAALNGRVIDNLHQRYVYHLSRGFQVPRYDSAAGDAAATKMMLQLKADTGFNAAVTRAFLVSLYTLWKSGKIPAVKYDPVGAAVAVKIRADLDPSSKSLLQRAGDTATAAGGVFGKMGIGLILLAGLGAAVYFKLGRK